MNNSLIKQKTWWKRNRKWLISSTVTVLIVFAIFSSGINLVAADLTKAYADTELYSNALEKVKANQMVSEVLGEIEPIDKMAILEGSVVYSNDNKTVNSSVRIIGNKGKAVMDIIADKTGNTWNYKTVNVRIKKPKDLKQTIEVLKAE